MDAQQLIDELSTFADFGVASIIEEMAGVPVFVNEFWTSKQRSSHSLHEISYRACFKAQLPGFFIERLTQPGDRVYDPFMGRGTTLIEASLCRRRAVGNDANPLSHRLAAPRINPPDLPAIQERIASAPLQFDLPSEPHEELLAFFSASTLQEILAWRHYFGQRENSGDFDQIDAWLQMVATNRLTGHSPGFFSVYTLPPNQATSVRRQKLINEKREQVPPDRDTRAILLKKSRSLLKDPLPSATGRSNDHLLEEMLPSDNSPLAPSTPPELHQGCASHTPGIDDASIDLVVTSPPFLNVVDYRADNWLRAWFNRIDIDALPIWQHSSLEKWTAHMARVFAELERVLRPGAWIAFEVGEIHKGKTRLEEAVLQAASGTTLEAVAILINQQEFTKTANIWGVSNNSKGTNSNRIVIFRKPGIRR